MSKVLSRENLQDGSNRTRMPALGGIVAATLVMAALAGGAGIAWGQSAASTTEPSLAEVARAARQKSAHKPQKSEKVITNEDIPSRAPETTDAAEPTSPPEAKAEDRGPLPSSAETSVAGSSQPKSAEKARARLQTLQQEENNLTRRYDEIQIRLASIDDAHLREVYSEVLARRDATLASKRKEIEEAAAALKALEAASGGGDTNHAAQ